MSQDPLSSSGLLLNMLAQSHSRLQSPSRLSQSFTPASSEQKEDASLDSLPLALSSVLDSVSNERVVTKNHVGHSGPSWVRHNHRSLQAPRSQRMRTHPHLFPVTNPRHPGTRSPPPHHSTLPTPSISPPPESSSSVPQDVVSNPTKVKCTVRARIPTPHGPIFLHVYKTEGQDGDGAHPEGQKEHLAIVYEPAQLEAGPDAGQEGYIRSRSLDSVWSENETPRERIIRGAYVGRLTPSTKSQVPSVPHAQDKPSASPSSSSTLTLPTPVQPEPPLVRIHSECYTGETVGSLRCDCGEQLDASLALIANSPSRRGIIVYLRQEGRGIGLAAKLQAYNLQDMGMDTVEANLALGFGADMRRWGVAGAILNDLGFGKKEGEGGVKLMTNNPSKVNGLEKEGVMVLERVPMVPRAWTVRPSRRKSNKKKHHHHLLHNHGDDDDVHAHEFEDGEPIYSEDEDTASDTTEGSPIPPPAVGDHALSKTLAGQLHPDAAERRKRIEARRKEDKERREWEQRRAGIGMIGGGIVDSEELDKYMRTKVEKMGHVLALPAEPVQRGVGE